MRIELYLIYQGRIQRFMKGWGVDQKVDFDILLLAFHGFKNGENQRSLSLLETILGLSFTSVLKIQFIPFDVISIMFPSIYHSIFELFMY